MARDLTYGEVTVDREDPVRPLNGTDEPVFIIRAGDELGMVALTAYRDAAIGLERPQATERSMNAFRDFLSWQEYNSGAWRTE